MRARVYVCVCMSLDPDSCCYWVQCGKIAEQISKILTHRVMVSFSMHTHTHTHVKKNFNILPAKNKILNKERQPDDEPILRAM